MQKLAHVQQTSPPCTQAMQKTDGTLNALEQEPPKKWGAISLKPELRVIAANSRHIR